MVIDGCNIKPGMCGILCYLFENQKSLDLEKLIDGLEVPLRNRGPDCLKRVTKSLTDKVSAEIIGCTLHLRGPQPVQQPLCHEDGSFLLWNGEIFDGIQVSDQENDSAVLFKLLLECEDDTQLLSVVSKICGPWAFIFWQAMTQRFWFGRDVLGRRSLLWNLNEDSTALSSNLLLSSVALRPSHNQVKHSRWNEVPFSGIFCLDLCISASANPLKLFRWSHLLAFPELPADTDETFHPILSPSCVQTSFQSMLDCSLPTENDLTTLYEHMTEETRLLSSNTWTDFSSVLTQSVLSRFENVATRFEELLLKAVMRRALNKPPLCQRCFSPDTKVNSYTHNVCDHSKLAILFSGGLDSCVLAALVNRCIPVDEPIDLLNVAFWRELKSEAEEAPDRISASIAVEELKKIAPTRKWNFVKIDVSKKEMEYQCECRIADLIYPLCTVLDRDIGCALWFASRGEGTVHSLDYTTSARVLLTGMGADEQLAGYSRHRICFKRHSWKGVLNELQMEMNRIASRNMGRDDRIISSHGREARFPYLDEELVSFLNSLPIWHKTNLNLPRGLGDKFLLRLVAYRLGLRAPAFLAKRAIQFGSKIAKMDNGLKGTDICIELKEKQM